MTPRLLVAVALVAASLVSIDTAPAQTATTREAASKPGWATDPAAVDLAADTGVSLAEAQRRISVQQRAPDLDEELAETLGRGRYGGVWIGKDDRVKVGIVGSAARAAVTRAATAHRIAADLDMVPVRHSLGALLAANSWLADRIVPANRNARWPMVHGYTTAGNTVRLGLPPKSAGMSPAQRTVLREASRRYGSLLTTYTRSHRSKPDADCAPLDNGWNCDMPVRGGARIEPARCTLGFYARGRSDNSHQLITAGHCLVDHPDSTSYYTDDQNGSRITLGTRRASTFGSGGDAGSINITNPKVLEVAAACRCSWVLVLTSPSNPGVPGTATNERYPILHDGTSSIGMRVCLTGSRTGTSCGLVTELGYTSDYGVRNLAKASYCSADGDSGGPIYSGNTAYGIHSGRGNPLCDSLYQGIRGAEFLLNADVAFDRPATTDAYFRHNKNELSPRKYNFYRIDGQPCHYRVTFGDYGDVAFAQVALYGGAPCNGTGVEVFGESWSGPWKKDRESSGHSDACGPYRLIQATSPAGHSANGMTVVTPEGNRIRYSHLYTDRPFNSGATCP